MSKRRTNADRQYDRYESLSTRMRDIFRAAIQNKSTHAEILAQLSRDIYDNPERNKLTQVYQFGLSTIAREWFSRINDMLDWRMGPESGPTRYAHKDPWTPADSELCRRKEMFGGHFWEGSDKCYNGYNRL